MSRFLNLIAALLLFAIALPAQTQQTAGNGVPAQNFAGGSGVNATSNVVAAFNVKNYGAVGGAQFSRNCLFTNGSAVITNVDNPWTAAIVGKKFQGVGAGVSAFGTTTGGTANNEVTVTGFTNAGSITVSATANGAAATTGPCVWYTQQDDTYMLAAQTAAATALAHWMPGYQTPTLSYAGTVYVPPDGYVACGSIFKDNAASNYQQGVSLIGQFPVIYVPPCWVKPYTTNNIGTLISSFDTNNFEIGNLMIEGLMFNNTNLTGFQYLIGFKGNEYAHIHDVTLVDWGSNAGGGDAGIGFASGQFNTFENIFVQDSPTGSNASGCLITSMNNSNVFLNLFCSNHYVNLTIASSGSRVATGGMFTLQGYTGDECGVTGAGRACLEATGSTVNCIGCLLFNSGVVASVSADTTTSLYITDSNVSTYNTDAGNANAIILAGNAQLFLAGSDVAGNNTGSAINGPSSATFVSVGANKLFNQVTGTRTLCTAATQTTAACGWSGGIQPKSTETHSPNTCYAVTGNLLATAQNICTYLLDQNYQVVNITAQSGGTTPTNSSCTGAPVITISDGTRSATLTMTTGKTQWSSAVDSATVNTVFAAGTTLTTSIGANTCATPPANVSVNMVLQSVLNF